jgi:hypothetical protein
MVQCVSNVGWSRDVRLRSTGSNLFLPPNNPILSLLIVCTLDDIPLERSSISQAPQAAQFAVALARGELIHVDIFQFRLVIRVWCVKMSLPCCIDLGRFSRRMTILD